jgi:hypothetical protein
VIRIATTDAKMGRSMKKATKEGGPGPALSLGRECLGEDDKGDSRVPGCGGASAAAARK